MKIYVWLDHWWCDYDSEYKGTSVVKVSDKLEKFIPPIDDEHLYHNIELEIWENGVLIEHHTL